MTLLPPGMKVHLALGYTDMRKGIDGLAMLVQGVLLWPHDHPTEPSRRADVRVLGDGGRGQGTEMAALRGTRRTRGSQGGCLRLVAR